MAWVHRTRSWSFCKGGRSCQQPSSKPTSSKALHKFTTPPHQATKIKQIQARLRRSHQHTNTSQRHQRPQGDTPRRRQDHPQLPFNQSQPRRVSTFRPITSSQAIQANILLCRPHRNATPTTRPSHRNQGPTTQLHQRRRKKQRPTTSKRSHQVLRVPSRSNNKRRNFRDRSHAHEQKSKTSSQTSTQGHPRVRRNVQPRTNQAKSSTTQGHNLRTTTKGQQRDRSIRITLRLRLPIKRHQ